MAFGLFKKKGVDLLAPLNGTIIPLEEVPDPVFSQKMMGEGVAIQPTGGHVYAPFSGEIIMITPTKHAIAIRSKSGVEVLIHIGLETVSLKGEGFKLAVKEGEHVSIQQEHLLNCSDACERASGQLITSQHNSSCSNQFN